MLNVGRTHLLKAELLARLGASGHLQTNRRAAGRRHVHRAAERRLIDRDRYLHGHVGTLALKQRMLLHVRGHDQVAALAAGNAILAAALVA